MSYNPKWRETERRGIEEFRARLDASEPDDIEQLEQLEHCYKMACEMEDRLGKSDKLDDHIGEIFHGFVSEYTDMKTIEEWLEDFAMADNDGGGE